MTTSSDRELDKGENPVASGLAFGLIVGGSLLLTGAYVTVSTARWPIFMPPQLDLVEFLLKIFGEPAATYIAGGLVGLLGGVLVYLGVAAIVKGRHA